MTYKALFSFIWGFMRLQKISFLLILLVSLVWALDATLWPYILRKIVDIFTQYDVSRASAWSSLKAPVIFGIVFWMIVDASFRAQGFLMAKAIPKLEANIRMAMFDHIQKHSPRYFNEHFAGALANKITDMTTNVRLILETTLALFIPVFLGCLIAVIFFLKVNAFFGIILLVWIAIHLTTLLVCTRKYDKCENIHGEVRSRLLGKIVDSLTNNFSVNLFHRFAFEKSYIERAQKKEQQTHYKAKRYIERMRLALGIFTFLGCGLAINGLMIVLWMKGKITTGETIQIFNTTWNIITMNWMVGSAIPTIYQGIGLAKQALSVMHEPQDLLDVENAPDLIVNRGEIVFKNVSFQYGDKKLFEDKDVHIRAGEKVGLVGFSGSGKSTFVNLILRFYPLKKGQILIDGQDIATVSLESLRSQVALIPQDPFLFHRTLEENISYGRLETSLEKVKIAATLAHCAEFIETLPARYNTLVGERGTKLSGGERQRIAIARAILANCPILMLDEATSALDSITENYIQQSLETVMKNRTTIVIAHRLSTLSQMDRILVFDQGKIVEQGTHDELLALSGHYTKMWFMQAGGFLPQTPTSS